MIDVFGEIAGVSFSPDNHALFLGIADRTYGKAEGRRQKAEVGMRLLKASVSALT